MPTLKSVPDSMLVEAGDIPELFRPLMVEKISVRTVEAGHPISAIGDAYDRILCLLSGRAKVVEGYRAAQEVIVESLEPGDVFGDLAFLTGRRWPVDASLVATSQSRVLEISMDGFQRVLRENSEFTVALLKSLGKKTVRVDRSEFSSPAHAKDSGAAAVCAYPSHPGLDSDLQSRFQSLAFSNESVLIIGENGVGKDILAYAVFEAADRHDDVLVPLNAGKMGTESFFCQTSSEVADQELTHTEEQIRTLFGYESRTADGSSRILPGYLDLAQRGTLFIRGAHLLTAVTQQKLLDAWRTGSYCPPGSRRHLEIDFRLICTTELDPSLLHPDRHPLLCELRETILMVPPLRQRRDLIPSLATHYLGHYAQEMKRQPPELDELTTKALKDYSWPGNDLELANAMRRAVLVSPGDTVRRQDLTFDARGTDGDLRFDLLRLRPVRQAMFSPLFPAVLQSAFMPIFLGIVLLLFFGPPDPSRNLAAVIMWSLAWPGVIVGAFLGARISCSICAIGALSKLAKRIVALELPFPEALRMRSDFLIAVGILFVIWIECVSDIRSSPFNLGLLLLTMFLIAFVLNTLFARQTWCRYLCPLGGMTGLFARTSVLELRADRNVCLSRCSSHECYYGTSKAEACAFGQVVATLHSNQFCKICGNCVKNCPYDAVRLNLRIPANELGEVRHVRTGTGFLVLSLNGALLSDILTRVSWYDRLVTWLPGPGALKFTVLYAGLILIVNLIAIAAAILSHRAFRERLFENYSRFALSLLPLTCMGFLALHTYYVFTLGPQMLALLGQYFGIEGLGGPASVMPKASIRVVQEVLMACGLAWTLIIMYRLGHSTPRGKYRRRWGVLPHALVAAALALGLAAAMRWAFPV
ncbi:MAG: sigma 54-interacting transcriptional regulator [Desulfomonile tiedjei]|uniref:Sigma 54-interacting transcriptional regulator n=1 Tax=Desulfomonile tiedjei TaxID=2358 RepID=A0A9D6V372_9BACT|nr:sigma 54-interacting transcriptional regulator [Desulfomonile tiedjei]